MSVETTNEPRTRATGRRVWPVAIAFAGSLLAGACGLSGQRHRRAGEDVGTSSGLHEPPA